MMRVLTWIIAVLAVLWGGYWFIGARTVERAANNWFDMQTDFGLVAERSSLSVIGFPNRFDLTVNDLHLADRSSGFGWRAPFVQVFMMTWKPWHLIAALPPEQSFTTPFGELTVTSGLTEASLVLVPGTELLLDRSVLVSPKINVTSSQGWSASADELRLAMKRDPSLANAHEFGLSLTGLAPDPAVMARLEGTKGLGPVVESISVDAIAAFSAPLRLSEQETPPQLTRLILQSAALRWGDVSLDATGELTPDANGLAEGRLDLTLRNGAQLVNLAAALGLVSQSAVPTYTAMFTRMERLAAKDGALNVPLTFSRGQMRFGPVPLGPAPRLN